MVKKHGGRDKIDRDRLVHILEQGNTPAEAARQMNCAEPSIRRILHRELHRLDLIPGAIERRDRVPYEEIAALFRRGGSIRSVAGILGLSAKTVSRARKQLGLNVGPVVPPHPPEVHAKAKAMLDDGASYKEIHRTLGVSERWVSKHFPGRGWTAQQAAELLVAKRQAREMGLRL